MKKLTLFLLAAYIFSSCKKDKQSVITDPGAGKVKTTLSVYSSGDTAKYSFSYNSDGKLIQKIYQPASGISYIETLQYSGSTLTHKFVSPSQPANNYAYIYQLNARGYAISGITDNQPDIKYLFTYNTQNLLVEGRTIFIKPSGNDTSTTHYFYTADVCDSIVIKYTWSPGAREVYKNNYYYNKTDNRNYYFNDFLDHFGAPSSSKPLKSITAHIYGSGGNVLSAYVESYLYEFDNAGRITKEMKSSTAAASSTTYYEYY